MSGFDLPPVVGFDQLYKRPQQGVERAVEGLSDQSESGDEKPDSFNSVLSDSLGAVRSLQNDVNESYKSLVLGEGSCSFR